MKKLLLAVSAMCIAWSGIKAQTSVPGVPKSSSVNVINNPVLAQKGLENSNIVTVAKPNLSTVVSEDMINDSKQSYRIGINMPVTLNMSNSGSWSYTGDGTKIWRLTVKSSDAQALGFYFDNVTLPVGAELFVYNKRKNHVIGAFTSETPSLKATEMIQGDEMTIEYNAPASVIGVANIEISDVVYFYRGVEERIGVYRDASDIVPKAADCQVNVACSEANAWQDQVDAAVHYSFSSNGGTYVCSGALINNTSEDCKPYILTATHCGEVTGNTALAQHVWYFNFENANCSPGTTAVPAKPAATAQGGIFRSSSKNAWNNAASNANQVYGTDFTLIELPAGTTLPTNAYFAGWDRSGTAPTSGVGIHHPAGHDKKISTYTTSLGSDTYNGGIANAHWEVQWSQTTNGWGVTEGGSSGSPIFSQTGLIVGMLSGGSSFCESAQPGGQTQTDLYGKMSTSWNPAGSSNNGQLEAWLDPTGTGATTQSGVVTPCSPQVPVANFQANNTNPFTNTTITLTDLTSGSPTSWAWTISGTEGTDWSYANGTNASSQNPQVTFLVAGTYNVTLVAANAQGNDSELKTSYITVTDLVCQDIQSANYTVNFDNTDFSQWVILNSNLDNAPNAGGGVWSLVNFGAGNAHSDSIAIRYLWNGDATTGADDWFVTGCLDFNVAGDYQISYWYRTGAGFSENIEVFLGTDQSAATMTTSLGSEVGVETATWTEVIYTFNVATAGTYYLGFHCTSAADKFYIAVDDINISYTPPAEEITIINSPANVTIQCDASTDPANTGQLTASTTCTSNSNVTISYADNVVTGACANASTITRTWTVTDNCGNTETYVQTITVEDTTAPTVTCGQSTDELNTSTTVPMPDYTAGATVSDNCSSTANITVTQSIAAGTAMAPGNYTVTITGADECGNTNTCDISVTVINDAGITITNGPANTTINCEESTDEANTGVLTASTVCAGGVTINSSDNITTGNCAGNYVITRTWDVTDGCGNTENHVQIITVQDVTNPTIDCGMSQDALTYQEGASCPDYTTGATTTDNCSTTITVTQAPVAGSDLAVGNNTVVLTATDECGNTSTCEIIVNREDDNTGVEEASLFSGVSIFPNPTNSLLTIDLSSVSGENVMVEIYDMTGKLITTSSNINGDLVQFDLGALSNGVYQVKLSTSTLSTVKRISKI